ncbi:MAG: TrbG/VirB9 family P-type conjugative transfer protein [Pseudomonadota bacterium]
MKALLTGLCLLASSAASAQVFPTLGRDTPRIQSVISQPGQRIVLTALPETALTVMLEPGEVISRITLEGSRSWTVKVSAETGSFQVTPQTGAAPAVLIVTTASKIYEFALESNVGLQAGYIVRLLAPEAMADAPIAEATTIDNLDWSYKLSGDRSVRPASVRDNGIKTVIDYAPGQALPAVFAIGPSGDEEVVDGYMRDGRFVIDRIHGELVFRIDKEKAKARRNKRKDGER